MSRSYIHTKIHGHTTAVSEKQDKQLANRKLRRNAKQQLNACENFDNYCPLNIRDVSNVWSFAKDGKTYWEDMDNPDIEHTPLWQRMGK